MQIHRIDLGQIVIQKQENQERFHGMEYLAVRKKGFP
jgi:hypothetical protein